MSSPSRHSQDPSPAQSSSSDPSSSSTSSSSSSSSDHSEPSRTGPSTNPPILDDDGNELNEQFSSSRLFSSLYNNPNKKSSENPLLPSIPIDTASILASKYDPSLSYFQSGSSSSSSSYDDDHQYQQQQQQQQAQMNQRELPRIPEKCFTFCTQTDEFRPLCRMFCLRKRPPILTREEQLKRLRPNSNLHRLKNNSDQHISTTSIQSNQADNIDNDDIPWYKKPFESLRKKITPYSFLYIKGTPDGVIGRYMEELEYDDGEFDFGNLSRSVINGSNSIKGKKRNDQQGNEGWVWLDWEEHGSLFHLPFTTIFHPILSIPNTLSTFLTPSYNLLKLYSGSFYDGSQQRSLERFSQEIQRGGALDILKKLRGHWEKKVKETQEKREEMMKNLKDDNTSGNNGEVDGTKGE
ncbi:uncharacterized protein L201_007208 [Kwoniella dendrophila CBS 6074]|uniref:Uncharacterized protein n=1 Tax=Kwoniella dendrophila CBS 6074 TaxID=1295534 RepID=A0AAX4K549_9TREE